MSFCRVMRLVMMNVAVSAGPVGDLLAGGHSEYTQLS